MSGLEADPWRGLQDSDLLLSRLNFVAAGSETRLAAGLSIGLTGGSTRILDIDLGLFTDLNHILLGLVGTAWVVAPRAGELDGESHAAAVRGGPRSRPRQPAAANRRFTWSTPKRMMESPGSGAVAACRRRTAGAQPPTRRRTLG